MLPLLMESARSTTTMDFGKGKAKYESQVLSFLLSHSQFLITSCEQTLFLYENVSFCGQR